jgi:hypothetical protein
MGYYTHFKLTVKEGDSELISKLRDTYDYAKMALTKDGETSNEVKWYDSEKDLVRFSKKHPSALFLLSGEGGESEDVWRLYVRNGKTFRAKARIVFEEFSEDKLEG